MERRRLAKKALSWLQPEALQYLGEGKSSVVFHDGEKVFKVFLLHELESLGYKRMMLNRLRSKISSFTNSVFFYPIEEIREIDKDVFVLIYPFEESESSMHFTKTEILPFLVECWQRRLIFQDLKPENFIRVNGHLKWIDYEPDPYNDNLFLNMCARAYLYAEYGLVMNQTDLVKLCRSAINQFELTELAGFQSFQNRVFGRIIFEESGKGNRDLPSPDGANVLDFRNETDLLLRIKSLEPGRFSLPFYPELNPQKLFMKLLDQEFYLKNVSVEGLYLDEHDYTSPSKVVFSIMPLRYPPRRVSLVIKACIQDAGILNEAVKHLVMQLSSPDIFEERLLSLDTRRSGFIREYNGINTWESLEMVAHRLVEEGIIHRIIIAGPEEIELTNEKWFGIKSPLSHTETGVPVASQLYAFDQASTDLILQVDCDAIVVRKTPNHSFLTEMIQVLDDNPRVLSVGFNICQKEEGFTPWFGFENGGFVPEVRFCLLDRKRIYALLPLPNKIGINGLKLSWYRALETVQKERNMVSIRGGHSDSFFIHPPNFRKKDKDVWFTTVDRAEQGKIPTIQLGAFDLAGSYYNWASPKRNEKLVVVSCVGNITLPRFLRFWYSLISQSFEEWGLILIDDASENGLPIFIKGLIGPYEERVTFIANRFPVGGAANAYKAIHYFMENQASIVVLVDGDDALIGKNALKNLYEKFNFWEADVVIGKMYRTDKLKAHYPYNANFRSPRLYGGNVWQHLSSFRKYLFDSLKFEDFKISNGDPIENQDVLLSRRFSRKWRFPEYCWDYAYMVPIVEMSSNPMMINHFNYLHDRTSPSNPELRKQKDAEIQELLSKPAKSPEDVVKGRKTFLPNLKKIEIDITYDCNLKCINCNRSSTQAPTKNGMDLEQIEEFVTESKAIGKKWELINLLGGEPTVHPQFQEIVLEILENYIDSFSAETILQITSNGFGEAVQKQLEALPRHSQLIIDVDSFKEERTIPYFSPFNQAPVDEPNHLQNEYHKGCWVTSYCGIGLNQMGYYPCGVASGIDRVFQLDKGIKSLTQVDDSITDLLDTFCRYCGNFNDFAVNQGNFIPRHERASLTKAIISPSWKTQYRKYNGE